MKTSEESKQNKRNLRKTRRFICDPKQIVQNRGIEKEAKEECILFILMIFIVQIIFVCLPLHEYKLPQAGIFVQLVH